MGLHVQQWVVRGKAAATLLIGALATMMVSDFAIAGKNPPAHGGRGGVHAMQGGVAGGPIQIPTTLEDFFQPGTQPNNVGGAGGAMDPIEDATNCIACHAGYGTQDPFEVHEIVGPWTASMMGQSARDPLFYAGLAIANQDAANAGEFCIRCHVPNAYLGGRSVPTDGSAFVPTDLQGVNCSFCHRLVNPTYTAGVSPVQDASILAALASSGQLPNEGGNSRYVIDPAEARRGPFDDIPTNMHAPVEIVASPFHKSGELCWTCHDVSNPLMTRAGPTSTTYTVNAMDAAHPTANQRDMFPLHRTYSEWKNSYYSTTGVQHNGRFGGNHLNNPLFIANETAGIMKDCQDCHMPDQVGFGCIFGAPAFNERQDVPQHSFIGTNTWVLNAVRTVDANNDTAPDYPDFETGLNDTNVNSAIARNMDLLDKASDMTVTKQGNDIRVRVINRAGHKMPTGFPDGRRAWINVKYYDCGFNVIAERGAYDFGTATLTQADTKVYEVQLGIDGAAYAASIGMAEGPTHHFMLANKVLKDNRIPSAGWFGGTGAADQTAPVGATYLNGQHWDDTLYAIPAEARNVVVTLNYQVTSKEFIEFLRDANTTNTLGQVAYDQWVLHGMSTPVVMDQIQVMLPSAADINEDGIINIDDLTAVILEWGGVCPCSADVTNDGQVDIDDLTAVILGWGGC